MNNADDVRGPAMAWWTRGAVTLLAAAAIGGGVAGCSSSTAGPAAEPDDAETTALCGQLDTGAGVPAVAGLAGANDGMAGALDAVRRGVIGIRAECPQHENVAGLLEQVVAAQPATGADEVDGAGGDVTIPGSELPGGLPEGEPASASACGPDDNGALVCSSARLQAMRDAEAQQLRDIEASVAAEAERYRSDSGFTPVAPTEGGGG